MSLASPATSNSGSISSAAKSTRCPPKSNRQPAHRMSETASFSLRNKVVIQFGGTGLLGRSLVAALGAAEATLVVASRNRTSLESLAANERSAGRIVQVDEVDIGSEPSLHALRD